MWEIPIRSGKKIHKTTSQTLEQVAQKGVKSLPLEAPKLTQTISEALDPSWLSWAEGGTMQPSEVPSNSNYYVILCHHRIGADKEKHLTEKFLDVN